jgi:hypothetical protein
MKVFSEEATKQLNLINQNSHLQEQMLQTLDDI